MTPGSDYPPETIQVLVKEGAIRLEDKKFGDDPDRYIIAQILPGGLAFIGQQKSLRDRLNP